VKILFLNYEFPPVGGGAAQASLTAATANRDAPTDIDGVRIFAVRAYRRGRHDASMVGAMSFLWRAAMRLPQIARQQAYDVYHYYFSLPTGLLTLVPGPQRRQPYVVSLRGSDVPGYDRRLAVYHRAMLPLTRRIWRDAQRVVANSEGLRELALKSCPERSIDVIYNGVNLPPAHPRASHCETRMRVLTVSRLIHRKGIDTLLRALARLNQPGVSLDVAGDGPDRRRLEDLAHQIGIADRVRFHGFTSRSALASLHLQSDLFVLTSLAESCSMALLEAMAAGLPVVATDVGGTPELVEHGTNGLLVPPDDVEALANTLASALRDPAQRMRLGAAGRGRAERLHSWRPVAQRYEAVFTEAIESARCATADGSQRGGAARERHKS
jgi:glycosyltransferase involved in cell wall biosynthesis